MYLIIDLEATCWADAGLHKGESEIIEIGAVAAASDYSYLGEFQSFVKPVRNILISEFCENLTSISQADVDRAPLFADALGSLVFKFQEMTSTKIDEAEFISWGNYDKKQFEKDCAYHDIVYPFGKHRNLKYEFALRNDMKKMGMKRALRTLGLQLEGTHHRALADAKNIYQIFCKMMSGN